MYTELNNVELEQIYGGDESGLYWISYVIGRCVDAIGDAMDAHTEALMKTGNAPAVLAYK